MLCHKHTPICWHCIDILCIGKALVTTPSTDRDKAAVAYTKCYMLKLLSRLAKPSVDQALKHLYQRQSKQTRKTSAAHCSCIKFAVASMHYNPFDLDINLHNLRRSFCHLRSRSSFPLKYTLTSPEVISIRCSSSSTSRFH